MIDLCCIIDLYCSVGLLNLFLITCILITENSKLYQSQTRNLTEICKPIVYYFSRGVFVIDSLRLLVFTQEPIALADMGDRLATIDVGRKLVSHLGLHSVAWAEAYLCTK